MQGNEIEADIEIIAIIIFVQLSSNSVRKFTEFTSC